MILVQKLPTSCCCDLGGALFCGLLAPPPEGALPPPPLAPPCAFAAFAPAPAAFAPLSAAFAPSPLAPAPAAVVAAPWAPRFFAFTQPILSIIRGDRERHEKSDRRRE